MKLKQLFRMFFAGLLITATLPSFAQQNISFNVYNNQTEIKSTGSITLLPGFAVPYGSNLRIFIEPVSSAISSTTKLGSAPSQDRNYIISNTIKKSGFTDPLQLTDPLVWDMSQTIQYMDGLGRPIQSVQTKASPSGRDIVMPIVYDVYGRETTKYLPYSFSGNGDGSYKVDALSGGTSSQLGFYTLPQTPVGVMPISTPFSITAFEASPLNRMVEQGAPGDSWQPSNGHTLKLEYGTNDQSGFNSTLLTNNPGSRMVALYSVINNTEVENTLVRNNNSATYGNGKLSLTISKDENWISTNGCIGTTEEYKDLEGHVILKRTYNLKNNEVEMLSTYYVYDNFGNLSFVLTPGAKPDDNSQISQSALDNFCYQYRYDNRNRINQKRLPGSQWEINIYDALDQLVLKEDGNQRRKTPQEGNVFGYDVFGRQVARAILKFDGTGGFFINGPMPDIYLSQYAATINQRPILWIGRDNTTKSGYTELGFSLNYQTINYYDDYKFAGGNTYSYSGSTKTRGLLTGTKTLVLGTSDMLLTLNYYDDEGRLSKVFKQHYQSGKIETGNYDEISYSYNFEGVQTESGRIHYNVTSGITTIAIINEYDHISRKLKTREKINSDSQVLLSSNIYNEIGQLKGKDFDNEKQHTDYTYNERGWLKNSISDQFSFQLKYEDGTSPQYNGNISGQDWGAGTIVNNNFVYSYDRLNRLSNGVGTGMSEILTYDVIGNILSMNRDDKNWVYEYNGTQLAKTTGDLKTNNYSYDYNGNATFDGRQNQVVSYNNLNLPTEIPGLNLSFLYDANGVKLKKLSSGTTSDYIDGIQYKDGTIEFIQTETGLARRNDGSYSYEYNLTDHLGNVRYSFNNNPVSGQIEHLQSDDYYPFGLRKSSGSTVSLNNKYLYNGKELQEELGQYDYEARFYDPVIARWNVVDREAEKYERHSPYAYVLNRPTVAVDPDGKRVYFVGGANNDQDGWNYVQRWANSFRNHGINDFRRVNMSNGKMGDVNFTAQYRNSGYTNKDVFMNGEVVESTREPVQNKTINKTVATYQEDLKKSPLKEGEQFNLAGYSYGSVLQAQVALKLANSGQVIDNLILIGSPIGDNSDLYKELSGNKNIKNILRYDLKGDALSNPQDVYDFLNGARQGIVEGNDAHHFDAARPGAAANKLIDTIVQWLKDKGVKN